MNLKIGDMIRIDANKLKNKRGFKTIGAFLAQRPHLFGFQRRKVALGFAFGMGLGVIPLPVQFIVSIFLCYLFRASIPGAFLATLIVNPFTYPIIFTIAYFIGSVLTYNHSSSFTMDYSLMFSSPIKWLDNMLNNIDAIKSILWIGVPTTGILLALLSYAVVRFGWYWIVVIRWKSRSHSKKLNNI